MGIILTQPAQIELKNHIAGILYEEAETMLDDHGADTVVCEQVADKITKYVLVVLSQINILEG